MDVHTPWAQTKIPTSKTRTRVEERFSSRPVGQKTYVNVDLMNSYRVVGLQPTIIVNT